MAKSSLGPDPAFVRVVGLYLDKTTRALVLCAASRDVLLPRTGGLVRCRNAKLARALERKFKEEGSSRLSLALRVYPSLAAPLESKYGKRSEFDCFLTDVENEFAQGEDAALHVLLELDMPEKRRDRLRTDHPSVFFTQVFEKDSWLAEAGIMLEILSSKDRQAPAGGPEEFREALGTCLEYCMGENAHPFAWRACRTDAGGQAQETTE